MKEIFEEINDILKQAGASLDDDVKAVIYLKDIIIVQNKKRRRLGNGEINKILAKEIIESAGGN